MPVNVLVLGSGGREHALVWKLSQSPLLGDLFCAPGNPGMTGLAKCISLLLDDHAGILSFAQKNDIGLVVVGPELPLVNGLADAFAGSGIAVFGPTENAARLEGSKVFAKDFMRELRVPTAPFITTNNYDEALKFVRSKNCPLVIKVDGLAGGKGAIICPSYQQAKRTLDQIFNQNKYNDAGKRVVIEECLYGQEVSFHAFCDGSSFILMPCSQDHKSISEGGRGLNTGGMGAIAPVPWVDAKLIGKVSEKVVQPIITNMVKLHWPYVGCLYPGLMIDKLAGPQVLEFNCRFGDPETQPLMMLLDSDLLEIMLACAHNELRGMDIDWKPGFSACVVLASKGYPETYETGKVITGLSEVEKVFGDNVEVFHAGTKIEDGILKTEGGRVLGVTGHGLTLEEAINRAYGACELIKFDNKYMRRDIGRESLEN